MQTLLDWSEVWSLLIPLSILLSGKRQPATNRPIIVYIIAALAINLLCNIIWKWGVIRYDGIPYNGFLYNAHSILRFFLFDFYFSRIHKNYPAKVSKVVRVFFVIIIIVNFSFFESFYNPNSPFSSLLLSVESLLLLILCLQYYFYKFNTEEENRLAQPDFWMITGLSIYVVINFFIFLLYERLSHYSSDFAIHLWDVHNISYILLNLFIAKAFYESQHR